MPRHHWEGELRLVANTIVFGGPHVQEVLKAGGECGELRAGDCKKIAPLGLERVSHQVPCGMFLCIYRHAQLISNLRPKTIFCTSQNHMNQFLMHFQRADLQIAATLSFSSVIHPWEKGLPPWMGHPRAQVVGYSVPCNDGPGDVGVTCGHLLR